MSAPSNKQGRKRPASLDIESEKKSAAEPMIIGTPTGQAPPTSLNPLPEPKSPSLSPVHTWRDQCFSYLIKCSSRVGVGDPDTPSPIDEKLEVVRLQPRARPTQLMPANVGPDEEQPEILKDIPSVTHMDSLLIRGTQCFLVAAHKVAKHIAQQPKLGICVRFIKLKCSQDDCTTKCLDCGVCPHLYECSCKVKYLGTSWCPHLHVMKQLTEGLYLDQGLMFIHNNWKSTEMRHLRAFIQGRTKMCQLQEGIWSEQFEYMMRSMIYRVYEIAQATNCICKEDKKCPLCNACLCQYICTCEDYRTDKQVCQHIHNVAMQKHERSNHLFTTLEEFGSDYCHSASKNEDPNLRYYMEQEHQMSFYFILSDIEKKEWQSPHTTEWTITLDGDDPPIVCVKKNLLMDEQCYCRKPEATKANCCVRCQICAEHYTCSCVTAQFTICRHMHAVARLESSRVETNEQKFQYLEKLLSREPSQEDTDPDSCRTPLGLKNPNWPQ